ncbi:MAG: LysM domain-containing protein [Chthoniobacterales bacterium]
MKIPLFSKLTAKSRGRKVVRASARAARGHDDDYYETEPNMKLSHAFMVVLILHVVAVGGIYAFNHINARKSTNLLANLSDRIAQATGTSAAAEAAPAVPVVPAQPVRQAGDADEPLPLVTSDSVPTAPAAGPAAPALVMTATKSSAVPAVVKKEAPAPAATTGPVPGSYKVEKGDNPYKIAKKFGVSYQSLLTLNAIEDPTKLQIGQELKIPKKAN